MWLNKYGLLHLLPWINSKVHWKEVVYLKLLNSTTVHTVADSFGACSLVSYPTVLLPEEKNLTATPHGSPSLYSREEKLILYSHLVDAESLKRSQTKWAHQLFEKQEHFWFSDIKHVTEGE